MSTQKTSIFHYLSIINSHRIFFCGKKIARKTIYFFGKKPNRKALALGRPPPSGARGPLDRDGVGRLLGREGECWDAWEGWEGVGDTVLGELGAGA